MTAPGEIISIGPPPLSQMAADCALEIIDFMAAVVRGVDLIDVDQKMLETWRTYLATYYPMLAPVDRYWFASAPFMLANLRATWPQLPPPAREAYRQTWAASLPMMLQFIDPVLRASHQEAPQQSVAQLMDTVVRQQQVPEPSDPELQAQQQLFNHHVNALTLQRFSTTMANSTIDLMHAMSGH